MSLIEPEDVEALMSPGLEAEALQDVIDREEDWLANDPDVGIGPLVGEREQTIYVQPGYADPLLLQRPTDDVEVDDGGTLRTDVVLTGPARIEATGGGWTGPTVVVTSTPNDELRVKRVLLELIRIALSSSPFQQEATEGRSYSRPKSIEAQRAQLARTLHPNRDVRTVRLGTGESHRVTW